MKMFTFKVSQREAEILIDALCCWYLPDYISRKKEVCEKITEIERLIDKIEESEEIKE